MKKRRFLILFATLFMIGAIVSCGDRNKGVDEFTIALSAASQSVTSTDTSATFDIAITTNFAGATYTITAGVNATSVTPSGLQTATASGIQNKTITVNFDTNTTTSEREVKVAITYNGGAELTHTIKQASFPNTTPILIAGIKWMPTNLTGTANSSSGHAVEFAPQGYGMFFKWGSYFVYGRVDGIIDVDDWDSAESPTESSTGGLGYDYVGLSGGVNPGDPCLQLGSNYKTPTSAQWQALVGAGVNNLATYQGVRGSFFGVKASTCTDGIIQDGCIFLPASGAQDYSNGVQYGQGAVGWYWSSSVYDSKNGYNLYFDAGGVKPNDYYYRAFGLSVRCVQE